MITNVTIFAALLKNIPMGCPDSILPEPLLRHKQVNCLLLDKDEQPYKNHLCLFRALTMYLHGHSNIDVHTSQLFTDFISKSGYDTNVIDDTIFLYNKDPQKLIIDFVNKLEVLAEKSKLEIRTKLQDVESVVNERKSKFSKS